MSSGNPIYSSNLNEIIDRINSVRRDMNSTRIGDGNGLQYKIESWNTKLSRAEKELKELNFSETEKAIISVLETNNRKMEKSLLVDGLSYLNDLDTAFQNLKDKGLIRIQNSKIILED